jgi:hypothetical protein
MMNARIHIIVKITEFMDIIHHPNFNSKHNVSESGICLRPQVIKPALLGPFDRASPSLWTDHNPNVHCNENLKSHIVPLLCIKLVHMVCVFFALSA